MDYALVLARALHIAATVSTSGIVLFRVLVAAPAAMLGVMTGSKTFDAGPLRLIFGVSLSLALVSGAAWFLLVAAGISDRTVIETFTDSAAWSILTETQFGRTWVIRYFIGALLAATLMLSQNVNTRGWLLGIQATLAAGFLSGLAWAGHAAATPGVKGSWLLAADVFHLIAAGVWLGGLVPLALLLSAIRRQSNENGKAVAIAATRRFSTLGILAVGVLIVTGTVNAWSLVGSFGALADTDYGHLLILKMGLFFVMICIAAINRQHVTPRLALGGTTTELERNACIEAAFGLFVIAIVGALGTLPPGIHAHAGHMQ